MRGGLLGQKFNGVLYTVTVRVTWLGHVLDRAPAFLAKRVTRVRSTDLSEWKPVNSPLGETVLLGHCLGPHASLALPRGASVPQLSAAVSLFVIPGASLAPKGAQGSAMLTMDFQCWGRLD